MRKSLLVIPLLLATASPFAAQAYERPVAPWDLDRYIGKTLRGHAFAPLGIVGAADTEAGLIQMVGPQGQVATIHSSMLVEGADLRAPALTIGHIAAASSPTRSRVPIFDPSITVGDPYVPGSADDPYLSDPYQEPLPEDGYGY
jgi:hypothetical protein